MAQLLAKDILLGKEKELVGRLSRAEGKLGRSLVVDLPTQGYRTVDHRTLKWIVVDNVKYTVKKWAKLIFSLRNLGISFSSYFLNLNIFLFMN